MSSYETLPNFPYYVLDTIEKYNHAMNEARKIEYAFKMNLIKEKFLERTKFEYLKLINSLNRFRNLYLILKERRGTTD